MAIVFFKYGIFGWKLTVFLLTRNFTFDKLEGADFKNDNIIFNFSPKFTKKGNFGTKLKVFLFRMKLSISQIILFY